MAAAAVGAIRRQLPGMAVVSMAQGLATLETEAGRSSESWLLRLAEGPFFEVFEVPLARGRYWSEQEEHDGSPVAVVNRKLAENLFGSIDAALGQPLRLGGRDFRIIGILGPWSPIPRYYDMSPGAHADADDVFIPQKSLAGLDGSVFVSRSCPMGTGMPDNDGLLGSPCHWLSVWALLASVEERALLESRLQRLQDAESSLGAGGARAMLWLENVDEMLARAKVVPAAVKYSTLIAVCFFLLCLANASGLLLAKYLRKSNEVEVRRALGASRLAIVQQFMLDALLVGGLGCVFALLFCMAPVWSMQQLPLAYLAQSRIDPALLGTALLVSLLAGGLSGLFPALWASRVLPAIQMKTE